MDDNEYIYIMDKVKLINFLTHFFPKILLISHKY